VERGLLREVVAVVLGGDGLFLVVGLRRPGS